MFLSRLARVLAHLSLVRFLKFAGIIDSKWAIESSGENACTKFRALHEKSKTQVLNLKEWDELSKSMSVVARMVLNAAEVIIATTIQTQTNLLKDILFNHVIIDEASVLTHVEMLCAWRGSERLALIGATLGNFLPQS